MLDNIAGVGLAAVAGIGGQLKQNATKLATGSFTEMNAKSLSEYSKEAQLRPIIAIEREIMHDPKMLTIVHTALSIYAGYYITALSIDNTIQGVAVGSLVGKYSPNRTPEVDLARIGSNAILSVTNSSYTPPVPDISTESNIRNKRHTLGSLVGHRLPLYVPKLEGNYALALEKATKGKISLSTESSLPDEILDAIGEEVTSQRRSEGQNPDGSKMTGKDMEQANFPKSGGNPSSNEVDSDARKDINQMNSLATGKLLHVTLTRDNITAHVDMLLKPTIRNISGQLLAGIANVGNLPKSMRERWNHFWVRGKIKSFMDYIFCRDLIEAHRRNRVQDVTGYYEEVYNRRKKNSIATLLTGEFSVGGVANTWIVSETTAMRIESNISGKLDNRRVRDKFMEETSCMTMIVYSPDYQTLKIYNHGTNDVSEISMAIIEKKSKKDGFDMDVFRLISQGSAPIL